MVIIDAIRQAVLLMPSSAWTPSVEPDGAVQDAALLAVLAGYVLKGWPKGMRLIVRKKRPYSGAQLRITDADGMHITCFATNATGVAIGALDPRYRQRAGAKDRIRAARDTGLRNLPPCDAAQNRICLEIVQLALDLLAWMPYSPWTGPHHARSPSAHGCGLSPSLPSSSPRQPQAPAGRPLALIAGHHRRV